MNYLEQMQTLNAQLSELGDKLAAQADAMSGNDEPTMEQQTVLALVTTSRMLIFVVDDLIRREVIQARAIG